jgi:hypothetical protein
MEAVMATKKTRNEYAELAAYLHPHDPDGGARQIDEAILASLRCRARYRNLTLLCDWAGILTLVLGGLMLGLPLIANAIAEDTTVPVYMDPVIGSLITVAGGLLFLLGAQRHRRETADAEPPVEIQHWFDDNGGSLRNWHLVHWPQWKRAANRTQIGAFTFWRRQLVEEPKYRASIQLDEATAWN